MISNIFNNNKLYTIIFGCLVVLILAPLLFGELSISASFLSSSFLTVCIVTIYYRIALRLKYGNFALYLFFISLLLRLVSLSIYHNIFYSITGTPFEVTFADSLYYDHMAREFANMVRSGNLSFVTFVAQHTHVDKVGYQVFLGTIYYFTNDSIVVARVVQAVISALTVLVAYKISQIVWNEELAKISAIIFSGFQPFLLYSTLHLREFLLVFLFLLMILYYLKIIDNFNIKNLTILIALITTMMFLRTAFVLVFVTAILLYIVIYHVRNINKLITSIVLLGCVFAIVSSITIFEGTGIKVLGYLGLEETGGLGGYTKDLVVSRGVSIAEYIGGPLFIIPSFVFPIPSLLLLNIEQFGQTIHWYFTGGLIVWIFFSCFYYIGIYKSIVNNNRYAIFIFILIIIMSIVLLESFYFTSVRFSQVKIAMLLLFVPSGMHYFRKRDKLYVFYVAFMVVVILGYNYLRIAGRWG